MADINLIVATNADKVTSEFNRLGNTVLSQVKKAQQLERGYKDLDRAFNKGQISAQKYSRGIMEVDTAIKQALTGQTQLAAATKRTAGAMDTMSAAQAVSTRRMGRGSVITQQAGYQVGDFLVQVQGGTNAFVAFGQQATQVAGTLTILGGKWVLIGTILGVVIPLTTALGAAMARTNTDTSFLADSLESISPLLDSIAKAAGYLKEVFLDTANALINNLDRMISYAVTFAGLIAGKFIVALIAARVATMSLAGSMVFLRGALIRTGIGALVVGVGELVFQFTRLIKAAGSFGDAMALLKGAFQEQVYQMTQVGQAFVLGIKIQWRNMVDGFLTAVWDIRMAWAKTLDWLSGTGPGGAFGLNISGGNVEGLEQGSWTRESNRTEQDRVAIRQLIAIQENINKATPATEKLKELLASLGETDIDVRDWDLFGGKGDDDKDAAGRESKLESFIASLQTEREALNSWYGEQQELLATFNESELEAIGGQAEAKLRLEQEYSNRLVQIKKQEADILRSASTSLYSDLTGLLDMFAGKSKAAAIASIALNKALAIAQAIQNTSVAVTKALIVDPTGILAARVATLGKIQVGIIAATGLAQAAQAGGGRGGGVSSGGGGRTSSRTTPSGAEASVPTPSAPKDQRVLIKGLGPKDLLTGEMLQELFDKLYDENQERGAVFMVST